MTVFLLKWLLGIMLGMNCIRLGAAYLLPRRELPESWKNTAVRVALARTCGVFLILLGLLLIYTVCAPIAQLPGHELFRKIFLM